MVDRRALVVTALCLAAWRLLAQIPVIDLSPGFIASRVSASQGSGLFAAIGPQSVPLAGYSLAQEGIGPYVWALILMSLVTICSSWVRSRSASIAGRLSLERWTRVLALLLSAGQAYGLTLLYPSSTFMSGLDWSARLVVCLELAAGTAIMIFLADTLNEYGLGFGYGAFVLWALIPLDIELHRIAGYIAYAPSAESVLRPMAVWAAFTLGVTVAGIGVLLGVRRVLAPGGKRARTPGTSELRILMSGVIRPPEFAFAVMFFPTLVASYESGNAARWLALNWTAAGESLWLDAAYVMVEAILIVGFALFVAAYEYRSVRAPSHLWPHVLRLAFIGGVFLALVSVAASLGNELVTRRAGQIIPMSGYSVLLTVTMVLIVVRAIEGHRGVPPFTASPNGVP